MSVRGWVYIISNRAMPGLVKIGFSTKDPHLRAEELNHTGAPYPYAVEFDVLVAGPRGYEQLIHTELNDKREGKEWFRCSVAEAIAAVRKVIGTESLLTNTASPVEQNCIMPDVRISGPTKCDYYGCTSMAAGVFEKCNFCEDHLAKTRGQARDYAIQKLKEEIAEYSKRG